MPRPADNTADGRMDAGSVEAVTLLATMSTAESRGKRLASLLP